MQFILQNIQMQKRLWNENPYDLQHRINTELSLQTPVVQMLYVDNSSRIWYCHATDSVVYADLLTEFIALNAC